MDEQDLAPDVGLEGEADAPVVEQSQDAPPPAPTVEDLAADMGWRPQDEFRGPAEKWKPAAEYLRATVDVNRSLNNRLKGLEDTVSRVARTSATITEQAVAKERARILAEREEAVEIGDVDAFRKAEAALDTLPQVDPTPPTNEGADFAQRNASWWNVNAEATKFAISRAEELSKMGLSPARQVARVEADMKEFFPELFPAPAAKAKPAPLNTPGNRGGQPAKKGFTSLPADVQAAALDYERRKVCTREEYAKLYYEEGAGA